MARPTDDDRIESLRRFLVGLARDDNANQLSADIANLHVRHNTFPGEVFMQLSADALDAAGAERERTVAYRELLSMHLPEVEFRGKEHRRIQYAILTAFAVHGDRCEQCVLPVLLDSVRHLVEQIRLEPAVVRACAQRSGTPLKTFVADLAKRHAIDIS